MYVDNAPVGTLGVEDQALSLSPGPSFIGSGPWTVNLNPTGANIASGLTKDYLIIVRTSLAPTDTHQFRVGLDSVVYSTAGSKTDLAVNAPGNASYYTIDTTQPSISTVETQDLDGNGKIDALKVTYNASETLNDSTIAMGDFTLTPVGTEALDATLNGSFGGLTFASGIATVTANDNVVYLKLSEGNSTTVTTPQLASGA